MHAYIYCGFSHDIELTIVNLKDTWEIHPADWVLLEEGEESSIGVAAIRQFEERLYLYPTGKNGVVGVIPHAEKLTPEAQQALLKTLEEPPAHVRILLGSPTPYLLLATLCSRCIVKYIPKSETQDTSKKTMTILQNLTQSSVGEKMYILDGFTTNREDAKIFIQEALQIISAKLTDTQDQTELQIWGQLGRGCVSAYTSLRANCNAKLALDRIIFGNILGS